MVDIEIGQNIYKFRDNITLSSFQKIKDNFYTLNNKKPEIEKPDWWYKKTDFGVFFLNRICSNPPISSLPENWKLFYPVFEGFFPTKEEYFSIIKNIGFLHGREESFIEDRNFINWIVKTCYGLSSYKELDELPFKETMILYYYAILNKVYENPRLLKILGFMKKEESEEKEWEKKQE